MSDETKEIIRDGGWEDKETTDSWAKTLYEADETKGSFWDKVNDDYIPPKVKAIELEREYDKNSTPEISIMDDDKIVVLHKEPPNEITQGINNVYTSMSNLIKEKNRRYGNSVMEPLGIFNSYVSELNDESLNGILIRLDDKLKRIKNSKKLRKNDVSDLMGYLAFLCVNKGWEDFTDLLD